MNTRLIPLASGLFGLFGLLGLVSLPVNAQTAPVKPASPPPAFQSALEGYQPYTDDKTVDWKAANDTTARVGGWRAYAREASAPDVPVTPVALPPPAPSKP